MIGWAVLFAMCVVAYRVADLDNELARPWMWAGLTFIIV
jgi:hypothetical protein